MLQKVKNKLRTLKNKWVSIKGFTKFWIIATIIAIILLVTTKATPLMKQENYSEMDNMVNTIVTEKTTDVDFDVSKVHSYIVTHQKNGEKEIRIDGDGIEEIQLTLTSDYQIKKMTRAGIGMKIFFNIAYILFLELIGAVVSGISFGVYSIIKKIVKFFKE